MSGLVPGLQNQSERFDSATDLNYGAIAQLVEQRTENPCVTGSIPVGTTLKFDYLINKVLVFLGRLAQLVQSVCLTSRGSGVRIPQRPLLKFFLLSFNIVLQIEVIPKEKCQS